MEGLARLHSPWLTESEIFLPPVSMFRSMVPAARVIRTWGGMKEGETSRRTSNPGAHMPRDERMLLIHIPRADESRLIQAFN